MAKIQLILKTTCDRNKPQEFICAPGFCLEVVAVASISLPHSLQPPRLLLGVFRGGGEAGEESVEASAREKRKERGVEQRVTVFQRSQRLRAGIEAKAALWQKSIRLKIKFATPCQLFFTFVYWPTLLTFLKKIIGQPCQLLPSLQGSLQSAAVLEVAGSKSLFLTDIIYCSN